MSGVTWPGRRADIISALNVLATSQPRSNPWPGLDEAVHWLVDDTWWDQHAPTDDIGTLLINTEEAAALTTVLTPLLALLDELGPTAGNDDYLTHPRWIQIAHAAREAHLMLTSQNDQNPEH